MSVVLHPYKFRQTSFLRTDNGSEQMAIDGRSTSAEDMWDGTGIADTGTENWTRGGEGSESAASKKTGTNGLDTGVVDLNDYSFFDYGSDRDLEASFDSVTFWMQPKAFPAGSVLRAGFFKSGTTTLVGSQVNVRDFVSNTDLNVWQRVTIPLSYFGMGSETAGRFALRFMGEAGQQFWFDVFELLDSSSDGPYKFRVQAPVNERWRVEQISLVIAASDSGWDSSNFATITDGLENGLILRHGDLVTMDTFFSTVMKDNVDLFGKMPYVETFGFGDNELMLSFMIRPSITTIRLEYDYALEFVVRDDLSTLDNMRAYLQYGVE